MPNFLYQGCTLAKKRGDHFWNIWMTLRWTFPGSRSKVMMKTKANIFDQLVWYRCHVCMCIYIYVYSHPGADRIWIWNFQLKYQQTTGRALEIPWDSMKFHLTSGWLRRTLPRKHTFLKGWHVASRLRSGWCTGHGDLQPRQGREHVRSSQLVELQNSPVTCLCNIYDIWCMMYDSVWYTIYDIWYLIRVYDIYIYIYYG